jgi:hypothetical protein
MSQRADVQLPLIPREGEPSDAAIRAAVMSFADDIPTEYLWCRDMRHAWDPDSMTSREVFNRRIERWEVWRTVRCMNCGGYKTQKLTKAFQLLGTDYDYPEGYHVEGSLGYRQTADDRAQIRALTTAYRGGVEKPTSEDRKAARKPANVTSIRKARSKRA